MSVQRVTLAITGASGSAYALRLLECLLKADVHVHLLFSKPARIVLATETDLKVPSDSEQIQQFFCQHFSVNESLLSVFKLEQWMAPVASGSNAAQAMVICPCSTGTLSAVATGSSRNLIERAADVSLKERKQLILVPRETPLSAIHLENMLKLSRLGVTILPASPAFYNRPQSVSDLVDSIVARILDHLSIPNQLTKRWGMDYVEQE